MAENALATTASESGKDPATGRGYFWLGTTASLLGLVLVMVQFSQKILIVPWYAPVLTTLGVVLLVLAVRRQRSFAHIVALIMLTALAGGEWFALVSLMKLPDYSGPVEPGHSLPAFSTTLADGRPFTDADLRDGSRRAMVFFRGRW